MPFFLIEGDYENETASPTETRQQAWQAVLSGAAGPVDGRRSRSGRSCPATGSRNLNTEGASTLIHLRTLLESYAWWTLVPDFANTFLTGGVGTAAAGRRPRWRLTAALPSSTSTRSAPSRSTSAPCPGSQVQARWYDPTSGSFSHGDRLAVRRVRQPDLHAHGHQLPRQDRLGPGAGRDPVGARPSSQGPGIRPGLCAAFARGCRELA